MIVRHIENPKRYNFLWELSLSLQGLVNSQEEDDTKGEIIHEKKSLKFRGNKLRAEEELLLRQLSTLVKLTQVDQQSELISNRSAVWAELKKTSSMNWPQVDQKCELK